MKIEITSVTARDGGGLIAIGAKISEGENLERRELVLLASQYSELSVRTGEIGTEEFEEILSAAELCSAVRKGMAILGYGAYSKKELALKLRNKGVAMQTASGAADLLAEMGYVDEQEDAARFAERSVRKYHGKRRIASELFSKGYPNEAVEYALGSIEEIDFSERCAEYIEKKYRNIPDTPEGRKKLFSALARMGYTSSEIKEAFRVLTE